MIEHVHTHITSELQQNTRTDTIFILTAILLNLITLGINSGMAEKSRTGNSTLAVMFMFVVLIVLVNIVVIIGLMKGRQTRTKLVNGLMAMYRDQKVDKYYDESRATRRWAHLPTTWCFSGLKSRPRFACSSWW